MINIAKMPAKGRFENIIMEQNQSDVINCTSIHHPQKMLACRQKYG